MLWTKSIEIKKKIDVRVKFRAYLYRINVMSKCDFLFTTIINQRQCFVVLSWSTLFGNVVGPLKMQSQFAASDYVFYSVLI